jgi:peptidoglycan/LPS O-acetylase OafA/YrhL
MWLVGLAAVFYGACLALLWPPNRVLLDRWLVAPRPHRQQYLAPLDAWRGLAALWVACFHCWQWTLPHYNGLLTILPMIHDGDRAVPLFVALSGFLIYRSVLGISNNADLKKYAWRRFLRIYPLYFATTVVALLVVTIPNLGPTRIAAELLMWRAIGYPVFLNPQAWSLYVEVAFYVLVPLYAVVCRRRPILYTTIAFLLLFIAGLFGPRELALGKFFAIGILASYIVERLKDKNTPAIAGAFFLAGIGGLAFLCAQRTLLGELGIAVAIGCLFVGSLLFGPAVWFLRATPFRVLGAISYSIFLWHSFVIMGGYRIMFSPTGRFVTPPTAPISSILTAPATLPLIYVPALITVAALSFIFIEKPMLALREVRIRLPRRQLLKSAQIAEPGIAVS